MWIRSLMLAALLLPAWPAEEELKPLFNGHDLRGWVPVNVAPGTFTVRDGMIVSTGVPTGVVRTARMYENFALEMDWRHMVKGGNAGLFVWADPLTAVGVPFTRAIEVQVLDGDDPKGMWTGQGDLFSIHGATSVPDRPHPGGWMRCLPSERRANPYGQWNHYRVECRDGRITLAVNGKIVSGLSQCSQRKGYICLESEGSECHFRNIRIEELPSSNPPESQIAAVAAGYKSLYTGLDLSGWNVEPGDTSHWMAKDWTLVSDSAAREIRTAKSYNDFALIVDWKIAGKPTEHAVAVALPITLRGATIPDVTVNQKPDQWNRAIISLRGDHITVDVNGVSVCRDKSLPNLPARGPVGLRPTSPTDFANLYIKPL